MKPHLWLLTWLAAAGVAFVRPATSHAQSAFGVLTREHTDLRILYDRSLADPLSLVMRDEDRGVNHGATNVILLVRESSRLTLPSGTPFGDAGQPFWILPQSQNVNLLYLGVSAENLPAAEFTGPLTIRLTSIQAPAGAYFMVWQATGPGQFNLRVNTRDGIGPNDAFTPILGSHEHFNWGFSATGVYCLTFQITAQRPGEPTALQSREFTFGFHVLPLPPPSTFLTWQKHFWPPGYDARIAGPNANPDLDAFDNLHEYAFFGSPTNSLDASPPPCFALVSSNNQTYATLSFTRNPSASDLDYRAEATSALGPAARWTPLSTLAGSVPSFTHLAEWTTWEEEIQSAETAAHRFYRLRLERKTP